MNVEAKRIHNIKRAQECFDGRASTPRKLFRRSSREYATAAIWRQNRTFCRKNGAFCYRPVSRSQTIHIYFLTRNTIIPNHLTNNSKTRPASVTSAHPYKVGPEC